MPELSLSQFPGTEDPEAYVEWANFVADSAFEWAKSQRLNDPVLLKYPHATGWVEAHMLLMFMGGAAYRDKKVAREGIGAWGVGLSWWTEKPEDRVKIS